MNYNPEVLMKVLADKHEIPVETSMLLVAAIEKAVKLADEDNCHHTVGIIRQVFDEIYEG